MFKRKEQWKQSSLTKKVFRELQSTGYHVFDYWRKHYLPLNRQMDRFKREGINTMVWQQSEGKNNVKIKSGYLDIKS